MVNTLAAPGDPDPVTTPPSPDMATRPAYIDDPMLLLARIGYRAYQSFRGDPRTTCAATRAQAMIDDLDRLTELIEDDCQSETPMLSGAHASSWTGARTGR